MNPALTTALIAAAQDETPDPVARLTKAGATNASAAVAIAASPAETKLIDQAIARGLIQRRGDGRLFVNRRAVDERNARLGYRLLVAALVGLSMMASAVALLATR